MEQLFRKLDRVTLVSKQVETIVRIIENNLIRCDSVFSQITSNVFIGKLSTLQVRQFNKPDIDANIAKLNQLNVGVIVSIQDNIYERQANLYGNGGIAIRHLTNLGRENMEDTFDYLIANFINANKKIVFACKESNRIAPYVAAAFYVYMIYKAGKDNHLIMLLTLDRFVFADVMNTICGIKTDISINENIITGMLNLELEYKFKFIMHHAQPFIDNGTIDLSAVLNVPHLVREIITSINGSSTISTAPEKKESKVIDFVVLKKVLGPRAAPKPKIVELLDLPELPKLHDTPIKESTGMPLEKPDAPDCMQKLESEKEQEKEQDKESDKKPDKEADKEAEKISEPATQSESDSVQTATPQPAVIDFEDDFG